MCLNWRGILNTRFMYILNQFIQTLHTSYLLIRNLVINLVIKLYEGISIPKGLSREGRFTFSNIIGIYWKSECVTEKNVSDGKKFLEKISFWEEQAFSYLLPKGKCGYNGLQVIPISPALYCNQRLLNLN